jgi:opacity protein-like surface antigen
MRSLFIGGLLLISVFLNGQNNNHFSLSVQLQPELTFHKDNYSSFRLRDVSNTVTFNTGIEAGIQYDFTPKLFAGLGIGYIPRKLKAIAFLDQGRLPEPQQSPTQELVGTAAVILRTIQIPVSLGYKFIEKEKNTFFIHAGLTANYLVNSYYKLNAFKQYQGTYKKNYWQGISFMLGAGTDYILNQKIKLTGRLAYSVINTVQPDIYLFSQDEDIIDLPHRFLNLSAGVKIAL